MLHTLSYSKCVKNIKVVIYNKRFLKIKLNLQASDLSFYGGGRELYSFLFLLSQIQNSNRTAICAIVSFDECNSLQFIPFFMVLSTLFSWCKIMLLVFSIFAAKPLYYLTFTGFL